MYTQLNTNSNSHANNRGCFTISFIATTIVVISIFVGIVTYKLGATQANEKTDKFSLAYIKSAIDKKFGDPKPVEPASSVINWFDVYARNEISGRPFLLKVGITSDGKIQLQDQSQLWNNKAVQTQQ